MNLLYFALAAIFFVFIMPTILRMFIHAHQRRVGTWNPEEFHKWIWLPWRSLAEWYVRFGEWKADELDDGQKPTAKWAGMIGRCILVFKPNDVLLGGLGYYGLRLFQPLGFSAERHLAMVAGTGTGKTTLLITMLGLHRGNVFVIDPKGQITKVIAARRGAGGEGVEGMGKHVNILDPRGIVKGQQSASWNVIDELARVEAREGRDAVVRYAKKVAEGLVPMVKGEKPYFPKAARAFIRSLILYVYSQEPPERRHMPRVQELLARGLAEELAEQGATAEEINEKGFKALLADMQSIDDFKGSIAKGASKMAETGKSYGDVLSTARDALDFYELPEIAAISMGSDFSVADLKLGNTDLFICAATGDIRETYSGWFRLLTMFALDTFEQINDKIETPTLFAIDEMPSLGRIDNLAVTAPVMRSYGVRLLVITQNLSLMKGVYPDEWDSFLGDADATYWMGTDNKDTKAFLSDHLGDALISRKERPWWKAWMFWRRWYKHTTEQKLLTPQQVGKVLAPAKENMIITRFGKNPLRVKTMPYYKELPVKFYAADTDFKETPARAATRAAMAKAATLIEPNEMPASEPTEPIKPYIVPDAEPVTATSSEDAKTDKVVPLHDPNTAELKLSIVEASALFGVSGQYTIADLDARRKLLEENNGNGEAYNRLVTQAYEMLSKPLLFEERRGRK